MTSLADKLRRRWTDTGSGPDVQKKLDAIEGTMKAREALKRLEKQHATIIPHVSRGIRDAAEIVRERCGSF